MPKRRFKKTTPHKRRPRRYSVCFASDGVFPCHRNPAAKSRLFIRNNTDDSRPTALSGLAFIFSQNSPNLLKPLSSDGPPRGIERAVGRWRKKNRKALFKNPIITNKPHLQELYCGFPALGDGFLSIGQSFSALISSLFEDLSPRRGGHSLSETVHFVSRSLFGLIRSFHFLLLLLSTVFS